MNFLNTTVAFSLIFLISGTLQAQQKNHQQANKDTALAEKLGAEIGSNGKKIVHQQFPDHKDPGKTPSGTECKISLEQLDYVGQKFKGPATCVDASNDTEAKYACGDSMRVINPANPQYQRVTEGQRDGNSENYYYCVPRVDENNKQLVCENLARRANSNIRFEWHPAGQGRQDGDCFCSLNTGGELTMKNCSQDIPSAEGMCRNIGLKEDTRGNQSVVYCQCNETPDYFPLATAVEQCADAARRNRPAAPRPTTPTPQLVSCMDNWAHMVQQCREASQQVVSICDPKNQENAEVKDSISAVNQAKSLFLNSKSGTGTRDDCFAGSLIANSSMGAIKRLSDNCKSKMTACNEQCNQQAADRIKQECTALVDGQTAENGEQTPNEAYFVRRRAELDGQVESSLRLCREDGKDKQKLIDGMLGGLGNALESSLTCMCQVSSDVPNCKEAVPPFGRDPEYCDKFPADPICKNVPPTYCTGGAYFDYQRCDCLMNPTKPGCGVYLPPGEKPTLGPPIKFGVSTLPGSGPNKFAGQGTNGGAGAGAYGTPGKLGSLGKGSGGKTAEETLAELAGANKGGGSGAGGGSGDGVLSGASGGGGGGGAGFGSNSGATEESGDEDGKDGGMFGQAKSFMSRALGLGDGKGKGTKDGKGITGAEKASGDMSKFKPRGISDNPGIGTKNMDIWKMINMCVNAETCGSNRNGFLPP